MRRCLRPLLLLLCLLCIALASCGGYGEVGEGELRVHFFDVGQGDSTLIRTSDVTILVDTGEADPDVTDRLIEKLRDQGIERLDCLVLTHPHSDHIGGAAAILDEFDVDQCLMPNAVADGELFSEILDRLAEYGVTVSEAYAGRTFTFGELTLDVLSPERYGGGDLNDRSIVLRLEFDECSILMTGDAEADVEDKILRAYGREDLDSALLKVPHHGSDASLTDDFLSAVDPEYAVISCGADNPYGHPHPATLKKLKKFGVRVFRTDAHGDVVFLYDGERLTPME